MPPKKPAAAPSAHADLPATEHMDRLVSAFETIAEEIKAIRQSVDKLQDDFAWAFDNQVFSREPPPVTPLTSMPLDPLAKDFGARLNRHAATDPPSAEQEALTNSHRVSQGELFPH